MAFKQVTEHSSEEDCWVIIEDAVLDLTSFRDLITDLAGSLRVQMQQVHIWIYTQRR
jgi:hypothetical protein